MLTATFESNILALACGNENNPDAAVSLYIKNGISHEKVKMTGAFFSKIKCEHCCMQPEGKRVTVNLKIYSPP